MSYAFRSLLLKRFLPNIKEIIQLPFNQEMLKGSCPVYHQRFLLFVHLDADVFLPRFGQTLQAISQEYACLNNPVESQKFALLAEKNSEYIQLMYKQYPQARYYKTPKHRFFYRTPEKLDHAFACYSNHLMQPATLAEQVAKVTTCIWLFDQIGKGLPIYTCTEDNPYLPWLYGYNDSSSVATTNWLLETLAFEYEKEPCPIKKENLFKTIQRSLELEYDVFHSAYTQEPIAQYIKVY